MYYLQSRYYDPKVSRFLNADDYASTGQGILGHNMFAYCNSNPVSHHDPSGYIHTSSLLVNPQMCLDPPGGGHTYIYNQDAAGVGEKALGMANVAHGGCGVVATYNALVALGVGQSFDDVLSYYNSNSGKLLLGGCAGILPATVADYFREAGYRVIVTDSIDAMEIYSKYADANILWYAFPATYGTGGLYLDLFGAHFVMYERTADGYTGYNTAEAAGTYSFLHPSDYGYKRSRHYGLGIFIFRQ